MGAACWLLARMMVQPPCPQTTRFLAATGRGKQAGKVTPRLLTLQPCNTCVYVSRCTRKLSHSRREIAVMDIARECSWR